MTDKPPKNMAHSVRQRLLNEAKRTGRLYNEIEQYYAMERFLYRLSRSEHSDKFVLKGALLFTIWPGRWFRATRDIDLLGRLDNSQQAIARVFGDICNQDVPDDGLIFNHSRKEKGSELFYLLQSQYVMSLFHLPRCEIGTSASLQRR